MDKQDSQDSKRSMSTDRRWIRICDRNGRNQDIPKTQITNIPKNIPFLEKNQTNQNVKQEPKNAQPPTTT